jgi:hypothetical protein
MKFIQYGKVQSVSNCDLQYHFRVYDGFVNSYKGLTGSCTPVFAMKHKTFYYEG